MPNKNCLAGIRCPKCGSLGPFQALTEAVARWTDDGVEDYENPDFADGGRMDCMNCDYSADVDAFRIDNQETGWVLPVQLLIAPGDGNLERVLDLLSNLRDDNTGEVIAWRRHPDIPHTTLRGLTDAEIASLDWRLNTSQQQALGLDVGEAVG